MRFKFSVIAPFLVSLMLQACADSQPADQRVKDYCSSITKGEKIEAALGRFEDFGLQTGGVIGYPEERSALLDETTAGTVLGRLAEPKGSPLGVRPVCAIYYSERALGGSDEVVFAEFKPEWAGRY